MPGVAAAISETTRTAVSAFSEPSVPTMTVVNNAFVLSLDAQLVPACNYGGRGNRAESPSWLWCSGPMSLPVAGWREDAWLMTVSRESTMNATEATPEPDGQNVGMVVGVDGSPGSNHALAWAAERTDQFGLIRPVVTWQYPWWAVAGPLTVSSIPVYDELADLAAKHADEMVSSVPEHLRGPVTVLQSAAGPTLVELSADASLLVVGTRGRGSVADKLLGSVSCHAVAHASVPVAVVPACAPLDSPHGRVVVGIDGSKNSIQALAWALRTARQEQVVEVVHTWNYVMAAFPEAPSIPVEHFQVAAEETMERTIVAAEEAAGGTRCEIMKTIVEGDPRLVLKEASEKADLLVLGARGHRGFAHAVLGSVTTALVHQPATTTIVVPSTK